MITWYTAYAQVAEDLADARGALAEVQSTGERGSGEVILNGATAHLGQTGDRLTIMTFAVLDEKSGPTHKPRVIVLGENNAINEERNIG